MNEDESQKLLDGFTWYRVLKVVARIFIIAAFLVPVIQAGNAGRGAIFGVVDGFIDAVIWGIVIYLVNRTLRAAFANISSREKSMQSHSGIPTAQNLSKHEALNSKPTAGGGIKASKFQLISIILLLAILGIYFYNQREMKIDCMKKIDFKPAGEAASRFDFPSEDSYYMYYSKGTLHKFKTRDEAMDYCLAMQ